MPNPTSNAHYVTSAIEIIRADGQHLPCYDPAMLYQEATRLGLHIGNWYGKANSVHLPRGREPGRAWVLMRRDFLTDSQLATWRTEPVDISFNWGKARDTTPISPVVFKKFYFVQATAIYADSATDTSVNTLFLVEFADARAQFTLTAIDETLTYTTWNDVFSHLWGLLPVTAGTYPGMPEAGADWDTMPGWIASTAYKAGDPAWVSGEAYYCVNDHTAGAWADDLSNKKWAKVVSTNIVPESFALNGLNVWDTIIGLLDSLGMGVTDNPFTGLFEFYYACIRQYPSTSSYVCTLSTNHKESPTYYPEKFRVYFPIGRIGYHAWHGTLQTTGPTVEASHYFDVATNITNAHSNTMGKVVYPIAASTALTLTDVADDLAARHTARVQLMANCRYLQYKGLMATPTSGGVPFLNAPLPGSQIAEIHWFDYGAGMFTELYGQNTTGEPWPELYRPVALGMGGGGSWRMALLLQDLPAGGSAQVQLYNYGSGGWHLSQEFGITRNLFLQSGVLGRGALVRVETDANGLYFVVGSACLNMEIGPPAG